MTVTPFMLFLPLASSTLIEPFQKALAEIGFWNTTWAALILLGVTTLIGLWIKIWMTAKIKAEVEVQSTIKAGSIKLEFDRRLKDYEEELEIRSRAEEIVDLLVQIHLNQIDPAEFNRQAWKLSLYLPAPIVCKLSERIVNGNNVVSIPEIIVDVRKYLLNNENDTLVADNVVSYTPVNEGL